LSSRVKPLAPRGGAALLTALVLYAAGRPAPLQAAGFRIFQSTAILERPAEGEPPRQFLLTGCWAPALGADRGPENAFRLDLKFPVSPSLGPLPPLPGAPARPVPARQPRTALIGISSALAIGGSTYNAISDGPHQSFHFTNEGFFGQNTYVGGGDKASHFVSYYGVSRIMRGVYELLDASPEQSYRLASAVSFAAGLGTEIGDGTNKYGFSYEDLVLDTAGAASAYLLARYGLDDTIGFRAGIVPSPETPEEERVEGIGKDYTREIYTADLKLAGLSRLVERRFGPARFLLLSLTYGVKGYPYAAPEVRERQVGLEVGLNMAEIARAVGVPENRWWGKMLLIVLDIVRIPYTSVGMRYDLNHHAWRGPDIGDTFAFPGQ